MFYKGSCALMHFSAEYLKRRLRDPVFSFILALFVVLSTLCHCIFFTTLSGDHMSITVQLCSIFSLGFSVDLSVADRKKTDRILFCLRAASKMFEIKLWRSFYIAHIFSRQHTYKAVIILEAAHIHKYLLSHKSSISS